ncbi:transglycosylase SLT domain-containing protein [Yoonia litorea]|uniref:Soluble lytic murein transglycosylase n=1 Tax=Yoonia litorea TaxID=1123755 RepID=A0A1I6L457_9RHOB|nr:transglycosylase SLT domain-containing protein [Yoonia litorea]SFR98207.1 soluble lytic murein transglycosylase [Yoonia litorea]
MRIFGLFVLGFVVSTAAGAQTVSQSSIAAISAADDGWDVAYERAASADPITRDVLDWLRLRAGDAPFAEYQAFLAAKPDWPGHSQIRAASERAIGEAQNAADVIAWFADDKPRTGEGAARLAQAYFAMGNDDAARAVLREAWINLRLSESGHDAMVQAFGTLLEPWHGARVDELLWRSRVPETQRMLPLLGDDLRALTEARIGYVTRAGDLVERVGKVPEALRQTAGFAYDRYSWLAGRGEWSEAVAMLLERSTSAEAMGEPFRWSGWRRVLARWEMREGRATQAYRLASQHFLQDGTSFTDLEWLAGYIALTYLGDPDAARQHFEAALAASNSPISLGRMHYWLGRTYETKGNLDEAVRAYRAAADHQTGFYGLLASEKIGRPLDPALAGAEIDWRGASVFDDEIVRAALILLAGGERGAAVTFFAHLGRTLDAESIGQLGAYLSEIDEEYYTLLLAKTAVTRGILIPTIYFPIHDLAEMDLPVDPALALSIARRESEFNTTIGSPVGALGLMQVMPRTAEEVAGNLGLPYSRSRLTADWQYNARIGSAYLAYLTEEFGPTPVMIAAGYNAGPSRPKTWMAERGDPRLREMDVIDWIEHIPFRETRNYVMRVTESLPIYQARLSGQTGSVQFTRLLLGEKPVLRPIARPASLEENITQVRPTARADN